MNGKVYFGELTFYPASGMGRFVPESWDRGNGLSYRLSENIVAIELSTYNCVAKVKEGKASR